VASSAVWQAGDSKANKAAKCHAEVAEAVDSLRRAQGLITTGPDPGYIGYQPSSREELVKQADLLRDIFGNPFRPVSIDPAWLTWNNATVVKLAEVIYAERRFADLPILADALEEAGCDNADILSHCREASEHVRGCWVVDLLLGKK
jgi:hypothetical protein